MQPPFSVLVARPAHTGCCCSQVRGHAGAPAADPVRHGYKVGSGFERLARLYERTDRPALAAEWKQKPADLDSAAKP